MRKTLTTLSFLTVISSQLLAQKVEYKNNIITTDGKDVAKVLKIKDKESFGLTSTFELYSLSGTKLAIATIATDFAEARDDNSSFYYRFSFLPTKQVGIFTLGKLGAEKSFARLIGEGGIVVNDELSEEKINELIARKGRNPIASVEYNLVKRNTMFPISIKQGQIYQGNVLIGDFKDISSKRDFDTYEFSLPSGLVVAKVSFTGGNNAKNCSISTSKDRTTRNESIADAHTTKMVVLSPGEDRNFVVLKRIAGWLVNNKYL
jgi:hypothetical protein